MKPLYLARLAVFAAPVAVLADLPAAGGLAGGLITGVSQPAAGGAAVVPAVPGAALTPAVPAATIPATALNKPSKMPAIELNKPSKFPSTPLEPTATDSYEALYFPILKSIGYDRQVVYQNNGKLYDPYSSDNPLNLDSYNPYKNGAELSDDHKKWIDPRIFTTIAKGEQLPSDGGECDNPKGCVVINDASRGFVYEDGNVLFILPNSFSDDINHLKDWQYDLDVNKLNLPALYNPVDKDPGWSDQPWDEKSLGSRTAYADQYGLDVDDPALISSRDVEGKSITLDMDKRFTPEAYHGCKDAEDGNTPNSCQASKANRIDTVSSIHDANHLVDGELRYDGQMQRFNEISDPGLYVISLKDGQKHLLNRSFAPKSSLVFIDGNYTREARAGQEATPAPVVLLRSDNGGELDIFASVLLSSWRYKYNSAAEYLFQRGHKLNSLALKNDNPDKKFATTLRGVADESIYDDHYGYSRNIKQQTEINNYYGFLTVDDNTALNLSNTSLKFNKEPIPGGTGYFFVSSNNDSASINDLRYFYSYQWFDENSSRFRYGGQNLHPFNIKNHAATKALAEAKAHEDEYFAQEPWTNLHRSYRSVGAYNENMKRKNDWINSKAEQHWFNTDEKAANDAKGIKCLDSAGKPTKTCSKSIASFEMFTPAPQQDLVEKYNGTRDVMGASFNSRIAGQINAASDPKVSTQRTLYNLKAQLMAGDAYKYDSRNEFMQSFVMHDVRSDEAAQISDAASDEQIAQALMHTTPAPAPEGDTAASVRIGARTRLYNSSLTWTGPFSAQNKALVTSKEPLNREFSYSMIDVPIAEINDITMSAQVWPKNRQATYGRIEGMGLGDFYDKPYNGICGDMGANGKNFCENVPALEWFKHGHGFIMQNHIGVISSSDARHRLHFDSTTYTSPREFSCFSRPEEDGCWNKDANVVAKSAFYGPDGKVDYNKRFYRRIGQFSQAANPASEMFPISAPKIVASDKDSVTVEYTFGNDPAGLRQPVTPGGEFIAPNKVLNTAGTNDYVWAIKQFDNKGKVINVRIENVNEDDFLVFGRNAVLANSSAKSTATGSAYSYFHDPNHHRMLYQLRRDKEGNLIKRDKVPNPAYNKALADRDGDKYKVPEYLETSDQPGIDFIANMNLYTYELDAPKGFNVERNSAALCGGLIENVGCRVLEYVEQVPIADKVKVTKTFSKDQITTDKVELAEGGKIDMTEWRSYVLEYYYYDNAHPGPGSYERVDMSGSDYSSYAPFLPAPSTSGNGGSGGSGSGGNGGSGNGGNGGSGGSGSSGSSGGSGSGGNGGSGNGSGDGSGNGGSGNGGNGDGSGDGSGNSGNGGNGSGNGGNGSGGSSDSSDGSDSQSSQNHDAPAAPQHPGWRDEQDRIIYPWQIDWGEISVPDAAFDRLIAISPELERHFAHVQSFAAALNSAKAADDFYFARMGDLRAAAEPGAFARLQLGKAGDASRYLLQAGADKRSARQNSDIYAGIFAQANGADVSQDAFELRVRSFGGGIFATQHFNSGAYYDVLASAGYANARSQTHQPRGFLQARAQFEVGKRFSFGDFELIPAAALAANYQGRAQMSNHFERLQLGAHTALSAQPMLHAQWQGDEGLMLRASLRGVLGFGSHQKARWQGKFGGGFDEAAAKFGAGAAANMQVIASLNDALAAVYQPLAEDGYLLRKDFKIAPENKMYADFALSYANEHGLSYSLGASKSFFAKQREYSFNFTIRQDF